MNAEQKIRNQIRKMIAESINNFIEKEEETTTKQLKDTSKSQVIGDPLDVELNQMADETGTDEKNAPTVSVTTGAKKGGNDFNSGQHKANFAAKTKITNPK
jgi:hypothetical protein